MMVRYPGHIATNKAKLSAFNSCVWQLAWSLSPICCLVLENLSTLVPSVQLMNQSNFIYSIKHFPYKDCNYKALQIKHDPTNPLFPSFSPRFKSTITFIPPTQPPCADTHERNIKMDFGLSADEPSNKPSASAAENQQKWTFFQKPSHYGATWQT